MNTEDAFTPEQVTEVVGALHNATADKWIGAGLTLVIGAVICTALLIFFIYNFVVLSEYTKNVSALNSTLTRLKQQQSTLELQLVQRDDLNEIEDYVSDRLGMIKAEGTQKKYITTVSGDKTVVITKDTKKEIPKQSVTLED